MSEQYGMYAPPPQVPGQPPEEQATVGQPARKSKTGLVIGIVIAVVLLACGCAAAAGLLLFSATESTTGTSAVSVDASADDRLAEWLAWDPSVTGILDPAPTDDAALISEGLRVLAPGFSVADAAFSAGYVDMAADYYYGDLYLVRAVHPSTDRVSAGIEFTVQSAEMIANDVSFDTEEGDIVEKIDRGSVEMIHRGPFGNADFPIDSPDGVALWRQIGEDWPDSVVMRITTETPDEVSVSITKWHLYAIDDYSPRLHADYQLADGIWLLMGWQYEVPEDVPVEPDDSAPVT
jgi:hypothetical protein